MFERLRAHLDRTGLIPPGARPLVGYSGGADSTCLVHLLHGLGVDIVAAHLHHGQREEADREAALCEAFCADLDVPFVSGRADVPRIAAESGIGLEEAGRNARYEFFRQAAFRLGCDLIATAHTRTERVETVILNLARGAGLAGLGGIPARHGEIVRPLLPFSREETRAYCEAHGLWTHDDPTNDDLGFARARVRHLVVPELARLNPAAEEAIARMADTADEENEFLNGAAAAALERCEIELNGPLRFLSLDAEAAFRRDMLEHLPLVLLRRGVRLAVGSLGGSLDHAQTLAALKGEKGAITAEGGEVVLEWDAESAHVRLLAPDVPFRYPLTLPGETDSETFGWRFVAYEGASPNHLQRAEMQTALNPEVVKGSLYFRTFQEGDAMRPLGFDGRRKVADLLSEAGLTPAARRRIPIVCDIVGPLWIPGVCVDERARGDRTGRNAIHIAFGPIMGETGGVPGT